MDPEGSSPRSQEVTSYPVPSHIKLDHELLAFLACSDIVLSLTPSHYTDRGHTRRVLSQGFKK
jgi:hypothetical protein